jgi:hypothetical protein
MLRNRARKRSVSRACSRRRSDEAMLFVVAVVDEASRKVRFNLRSRSSVLGHEIRTTIV